MYIDFIAFFKAIVDLFSSGLFVYYTQCTPELRNLFLSVARLQYIQNFEAHLVQGDHIYLDLKYYKLLRKTNKNFIISIVYDNIKKILSIQKFHNFHLEELLISLIIKEASFF